MLDEKTRGNLTADEQVVMKDMLYALRMKFVKPTSRKSETLHTLVRDPLLYATLLHAVPPSHGRACSRPRRLA